MFAALPADWRAHYSLGPDDVGPVLLFTLWAVVLVLLLAMARMWAAIKHKRTFNTFKPTGDTETLDAFSRAHMNTVENLPIFAVVHLSAAYLTDDPAIPILGMVVLAARVLQSVMHIASRSNAAVTVRAVLQFTQIVCFAWLGFIALSQAPQVVY